MSIALARLASEVGTSERTLRRAVRSGLIHSAASGAAEIELAEEERAWVRSHWSLVAGLRAVLRTEPGVELAVLFGSAARGDDIAGASDVDLLISLRGSRPHGMEVLRERFSSRFSAEVQLVSLDRARGNPHLLAEIAHDGRPIVDRGGRWPGLLADVRRTRAHTEQAGRGLREGAVDALAYFQRLAAARAETPVGLAS